MDENYDGWSNECSSVKARTAGKEYQFKRDMKAKQEEANVYSAIGVCICVCLWIYLAFTIFPK